uniref:RNase H type-1 domain-containing protein n=1 Tax=Fagus sylvatica TaxID=28930 RepID=A0A2N9GVG0_FAGSY
MHMVSWDKVCRPKDLGGLGLYSAKARNLALLAKLNWRVMKDLDSLWVHSQPLPLSFSLLHGQTHGITVTSPTRSSPPSTATRLDLKHRQARSHQSSEISPDLEEIPPDLEDLRSSAISPKWSGSSNWKGLRKGHEVFRKGLRWVVNNGHTVSFWHDLWVGDSPLRTLVHGPLSIWEDTLRVCDVVEGVQAIGATTSVQAKLRALKDGLELAIDLGILNLEIEMDSLVAVELANSITTPNIFLSAIVTDCRSLMERFELCSLKHIFREANGCADLLAKAGYAQSPDFLSFSNAPTYLLEALAFDVSKCYSFPFD